MIFRRRLRVYRFHPTRRWRFDFAWPARRVACEIDGGQWRAGGGRHNGDPDREKLNTAAALGWRVLRFSHQALEHDPAGCVELAAAAVILGDDGGQLEDDPGVEGAAPGGDPAPAVKLQRGEPVKLQRRPGLQLARPHPVKLARRVGDSLGGDPAGGVDLPFDDLP